MTTPPSSLTTLSTIPDVAVFVLDELRENVGGDEELLGELIELFLESTPEQMAEIGRAVAAQDAEALRQAAHALKGSAANFAAGPTVEAALRLEMMGKSGELSSSAEARAQLQFEIDRLQRALAESIGRTWESPSTEPAQVEAEPTSARATDSEARSTTGEAATPAQPAPVYFVDDDAGLRRIAASLLERAGYRVETFESGERGLEAIARCTPQAVFLDLNMPGLSGLETMERIKADHPRVPVVILTSDISVETVVAAMQSGAYDYLAKPIDGTKLVTTLNNALELDKVHAELEQAEAMLIQAAKMESVGQLAAGVAHEIKNPLGVILQGVAFLAEIVDDEGGKMVLDRMEKGVRRADTVIRGLLDFSAPHELSIEPAQLNEVVEQAILMVEHELSRGSVDLVRELDPELPAVSLDSSKIQQVLINLMMNAKQAMPRGGTLTVRTYITEEPAGQRVAVAQIDDTGEGIPEEKLHKLFDPFFTTKPTGEGTGLGLTVTRKIAELHGGTLDLDNRSAGGVRATLKLRLGEST